MTCIMQPLVQSYCTLTRFSLHENTGCLSDQRTKSYIVMYIQFLYLEQQEYI